MEQIDPTEIHERQVRAVMKAVAGIVQRTGFPPEAVIEGAMRGASAVAVAAGSDACEAAALFEDWGQSLRDLDRPNLRLVQ